MAHPLHKYSTQKAYFTMTRPDSPNNKENKEQKIKKIPAAGDCTVFMDKTRISSHRNAADDIPSPLSAKGDELSRNKDKLTDSENITPLGMDVTQFKPSSQNEQPTEMGGSSPKTCIRDNAHLLVAEPATDKIENTHVRVLKERFVLENILGVGGMGVVYKAKDRLKVEAQDREPYVAIKVLSEEFKTHPEAFIALQRESRKAQRIAHPNTVKVYDFDRDGDVVFMTMEYMEGKPLDQLIKQYQSTGLPQDDVWNILSGMCSALAHAHSENIVHSDFKPGNVFVTTNGVAKIFDFGIARAVANIDRHTGKEQDQTVFDAGGLGALTPAYASREMLLGETPDVRDDIYALGCVIYELFSGEHPFNRLPADEAYDKNLKPKRINSVNKCQWKAIEAALSFKRENRIESVDALYQQMTIKKKPKFLWIVSLLLSLGVAFYVYTETMDVVPPPVPQVSESDIRNELEFNIRHNLYKENIAKLLAKPSFTSEWEESIWSELRGMLEILSGEPSEWYLSTQDEIYQLYLDEIGRLIKENAYQRMAGIIENAYRYTDGDSFLDDKKIQLAEMIKKKEFENKKRAAIARERRNIKAIELVEKEKEKEIEKDRGSFNTALANVNEQLKCSSRLNMRDFNIAIGKLRSLDYQRYETLESTLSKRLAQCISVIAERYPEHALDSKQYALQIFKNNAALMAIAIKEKDVCNLSIAGLGARGERAICRDKIKGVGVGPVLVVIPAGEGIEAFAIGKYETSIAELNEFCKVSPACNVDTNKSGDLPATNVEVSTVLTYVNWLSKKSQKNYRLPTKEEWVYAANAESYTLDPNRNCQLSARGIKKGRSLVKTATGKPNAWGLVNYVGNAREIALESTGKFVVLGGSHRSMMESCTVATTLAFSGNADQYTGFRIIRDISEK